MRVYEEYRDNAEKRRAQRGARRAIPTGQARGYVFLFDENGRGSHGNMEGLATVIELDQGAEPHTPRAALNLCGISDDYLRTNCRRVGRCHLTGSWKVLADDLMKDQT